MSLDFFEKYDEIYPGLIVEIVDYFSDRSSINTHSVITFCEEMKMKGNEYDPFIINAICQRLCNTGRMLQIAYRGVGGIQSNYLSLLKLSEGNEFEKSNIQYALNSAVYGFEYIYKTYKDSVIPLIYETPDGDYEMGTGFKFLGGIVTAKHCITDVKNLKIKGYTAKDLSSAEVYVSENEGVDLAFIFTGRLSTPQLYTATGEVMQEVIVLGYPKVPTFTDILTAEKCTISAKAESRITPTLGAISGYGYEYLAKNNVMLITARVRAGNSGGPVINQDGCLVGIVCQAPEYDNKQDDLGYGIAIPVKQLLEIIGDKNTLKVAPGFFLDYD